MTGELPSALHRVIAFTCDLQGKSRIMWSCSGVSFENTSFKIARKAALLQGEKTSSRIYLQGTRKLGCHAHIEIREYRLHPEYAFSATETKCLKRKQLRQYPTSAVSYALRGSLLVLVLSLQLLQNVRSESVH